MQYPSGWQRVIFSACVLFGAMKASAGWPSGSWPSETHPREGYGQLSSVWSATWERCAAAGVTSPVTPTWHRPGTNFSPNLKGCLKAAIPFYVDRTGISSYTNYFLSVNTNARSLPKWTVTGLLVACKMPTNWLDYTPPRGLADLGGATNDATVGHPYGYTNEWTILGGTNYPTGRSKWYTTDYGYGKATNIFGRLIDIEVTPTVSNAFAGTSITGVWSTFESYDAVTNASTGIGSYYTTVSTNVGWNTRGFGSYYANFMPLWIGDLHFGDETSGKWLYIWTNRFTNVSVEAQYFMNIGPFGRYEYTLTADHFYTNTWVTTGNVSNWPKYVMNLLTNVTYQKGSNVLLSPVFGTTNRVLPLIGFASDFPTNIYRTYMRETKGWEFWDTDTLVLRYDFVYK